MAPDRRAYSAACSLLAHRELSEAQVRQRLARRGYTPADVDEAVARLKAERVLDDARVADAIARAEIVHKRRGRRRVVRAIERAGVDRDTARRRADQAFAEVDEDAQLAGALEKRLRGRAIRDEADRRRLFRYLTAQGFEPGRILAALKAFRK